MSRPTSTPTLQIIQPGMLTTIQDKGRFGYQRFGMPVAGAMDAFALRAANLLLGNPDSAAGLEATVLGPQNQVSRRNPHRRNRRRRRPPARRRPHPHVAIPYPPRKAPFSHSAARRTACAPISP